MLFDPPFAAIPQTPREDPDIAALNFDRDVRQFISLADAHLGR